MFQFFLSQELVRQYHGAFSNLLKVMSLKVFCGSTVLWVYTVSVSPVLFEVNRGVLSPSFPVIIACE